MEAWMQRMEAVAARLVRAVERMADAGEGRQEPVIVTRAQLEELARVVVNEAMAGARRGREQNAVATVTPPPKKQKIGGGESMAKERSDPTMAVPTRQGSSEQTIVIRGQMEERISEQRPMTMHSHGQRDSDSGAERRYLWGNAWHLLPDDFEIPMETLSVMWRLWCCGDPVKGHCPLRRVAASDIATINNRKRLSDLRFLMRYIEHTLKNDGVWKESPTEAEADQMLYAVRGRLQLSDSNGKLQQRAVESLKWLSVVNTLRALVKKTKQE